ncbi:peptidase C45 [Allostella sp. ATCC 35155]|nr:peptidase C45 [Stella sp. ATCC 35155]
MRKRYVFAHEDRPGLAWRDRFTAGRQEAERWYRGDGLGEPPSAAECRAALARHMPELLPRYDDACGLVGDDPFAHRILSHFRPPPVDGGCSQAVWLGEDGPALVRNYDYALPIVTGRFESSRWFGREVIAAAQRPWGGCLDGMNADGLVASLTAGGRRGHGRGFSVILMLRYVLETCARVDEAVRALCRIPIAQSQNVVLLDAAGDHALVHLGPDREAAVVRARICTNHQEQVGDPASPAEADSLRRHQAVAAQLADPAMTLDRLQAAFLEPPVFSRRAASATAYTAVYRPAERRVDYIWPGTCWRQAMGRFRTGEYVHDHGALDPP